MLRTSLYRKSKTNGGREFPPSGRPSCQLFGTQISDVDVNAAGDFAKRLEWLPMALNWREEHAGATGSQCFLVLSTFIKIIVSLSLPRS